MKNIYKTTLKKFVEWFGVIDFCEVIIDLYGHEKLVELKNHFDDIITVNNEGQESHGNWNLTLTIGDEEIGLQSINKFTC